MIFILTETAAIPWTNQALRRVSCDRENDKYAVEIGGERVCSSIPEALAEKIVQTIYKARKFGHVEFDLVQWLAEQTPSN